MVPTDAVFAAWTSGDLERMRAVMHVPTNALDRHFLLQSIIELSYKGRRDPMMRRLCRDAGEAHLRDFPQIAPALAAEMGGQLPPRITTFVRLAIVLGEDGEYSYAIRVCETALKYGISDGTAGGFAARINRLKKAATSV